jgi:hypothetical protein
MTSMWLDRAESQGFTVTLPASKVRTKLFKYQKDEVWRRENREIINEKKRKWRVKSARPL